MSGARLFAVGVPDELRCRAICRAAQLSNEQRMNRSWLQPIFAILVGLAEPDALSGDFKIPGRNRGLLKLLKLINFVSRSIYSLPSCMRPRGPVILLPTYSL